MATVAHSTRLPVGATPGTIQSIAMLCVKRMTISSTNRPEPMVREIGTISVSVGICGIEVLRIKLLQLFLANSARQHRNVVHISVRNHRVQSRTGIFSRELIADVFIPNIAERLLSRS